MCLLEMWNIEMSMGSFEREWFHKTSQGYSRYHSAATVKGVSLMAMRSRTILRDQT